MSADYLTPVVSRRNQATVPIIFLPVGALVLLTGLATVMWLALHGPAQVPAQDTRITAVLISVFSRLSCLVVGAALIRSAWASFLNNVLSGELVPVRTLVGVCRSFMSVGQLENYGSLPKSFKYHIILAIFTSLAMTGTSASFRYESLAQDGHSIATVVDAASVCDQSLITNTTGYFCSGQLNGNTTASSWGYIEEVTAGGQGTVYRQGQLSTDRGLSANVTLGILPPGWSTVKESGLPWMAISVSCESLPLSAVFSGSGASANATIFVNGKLQDILDVS